MRKLLLLAMLLAPLSQAETLFSNFRYMWANNGTVPPGAGSACNSTTSVCAYWEAGDSDNVTVAQTMKVCWSDQYLLGISPTDALWSNGNCTTLTSRIVGVGPFAPSGACASISCNAIQYPLPAPGTAVGSVTPSDGSLHYFYFKMVSPTNSPAADRIGDGSPMAYRYALTSTGNPGYRTWPSNVPATPVPLTGAGMVVVANTNDQYSTGLSSGSTGSCAVSWGHQSGTIYDNGAAYYFMQQHGIPCDSTHVMLVALTVTQTLTNITANTAMNNLLTDIASTSREAIAIAWAQPSLVSSPTSSNSQSISNYLATGVFATGAPFQGAADLHPLNPYFNSGTNTPFTTHGVRIAMMLAAGHCTSLCFNNDPNDTGGTNNHGGGGAVASLWTEQFSAIKTVIDAAVAAYGTNPTTGRVVLNYTGDTKRTAPQVPFIQSPLLGAPSSLNPSKIASAAAFGYGADGSGSATFTVGTNCTSNVLLCVGANPNFYFTSSGQNPFLAGVGIGMNVTSTGGAPPNDFFGNSSQSTMLGWLAHGAVAAVGSAFEPGQVPLHFPVIEVMLDNYTHGRTVIESMWASMRLMPQTNMTGDPLANPFASASVASTGSTVRGVTMRGVTVR